MIDRREELGLDPERLLESHCSTCGDLRPVQTRRDPSGTKHYYCAECGTFLGREAAGSFEEPDYDD